MLPNQILTLTEQREIFSYKSRMNNLNYNFPRTKHEEKCIFLDQLLKNEHLYQCKLLNNNIIPDLKYEDIFKENL